MRVIDLTTLSGAYACRIFAAHGHEVIRMEAPGGDEIRRLPPFLRDQDDLEHGAYHHFLNAGKKSVTADLSAPEDRQIVLDLLARADLLVANHPLPMEERLYLAANPQLVLAKIVDDEPELCAVARSGFMSL